MAAGNRFIISIVLNAKDNASKAIRDVTQQIRGIVKGIASPIQGVANTLGQLGDHISTVFRTVAGAVNAVVSPIVNAGKAIVRFSTNLVGKAIDKLKSFAKWVAIVGAVLAEEFARRSINSFADYEQAITNATSVTGLMGAELESAKKKLFDVGLAMARTSSMMPSEIADAFYSLASAGFSVTETMAAAPGVMALAEGTLADMQMTAELASSALRAFNMPATEMNRVVNVLAATVGKSRANMERLAVAMPYVSAASYQLGVSLEQTSAALGVLLNRGMEASTAGTSLRMMFTQLMAVTGEGKAVLKKYGLSLDDVNVKERGLVPVLKTLRKAGLTFADTTKLVGVRAANAALILKDNTAELERVTAAVTGTNYAFSMQQQQMNTVQRAWAVVKSTLQEVEIRFAKRLEPAVRFVTARFQAFLTTLLAGGQIERAADWVSNLAAQVWNTVAAFLQTDQAKQIWDALLSTLKAVWDTVVYLAAQVWELGTAGVQALADLIVSGKLKQSWDEFSKRVVKAVTFVVKLVPKMIPIVKGVLSYVGQWIKYGAEWFMYLVAVVRKNVPEIAKTVVPVLAAVAKGFVWVGIVGETVVRLIQILTHLFGTIFLRACQALSFVFESLVENLAQMLEFMAKIPGMGWAKPFAEDAREMANGFRDATDIFGQEAARRFGDLVRDIEFMQNIMPKSQPYLDKIDAWQQNAMGWAGSIDTSGIVVPPAPAMPGTAGGPDINITINGNQYGYEDFEAEVSRVLGTALRDAGYQPG
jgi:TP901 family phage tail tape measure protein